MRLILPPPLGTRNDRGKVPRPLRLLGIFLDGQPPAEYNIYQTNITESHKQKNRKQNMADTKIKPQHHPAKSSLKSPLSLYFLLPLCLSDQDPPSTLVETPLQIALFFAKQTQCQNGQYDHKCSNTKGLCQRTTNNEQRTLFKTNPIKANSPAPERDTTDVALSGYQVYNDMYYNPSTCCFLCLILESGCHNHCRNKTLWFVLNFEFR